jgi:O-antigen ligase
VRLKEFWHTARERAVYVLLFFLPIGGMSVRHWVSGTFGVLVLLSLPEIFRRNHWLAPPERRLLWIAALFFALFVITAVANGWTPIQTHYLGRELHFLVLLPLYFMVRRYPEAGLWLLRGGVVGGFTMLAQALYDVYVLHMARAQGIYSPNLLGPYAAMIAVLLLVFWRMESQRQWLRYVAVASIVAGLAAVALSGSRGAFVGLLGMLLTWAALRFRGRYFAAVIGGIVGLSLLGYVASDHVKNRVNTAVGELWHVIQVGDVIDTPGELGPVAARLELWYAALLIFQDHPILGIGRGNYPRVVRGYVDRGLLHPTAEHHGHVHNAYLEMLISKGIFGLLLLLALLFYPFAVFVRTLRRSRDTATVGAVVIAGFALFSITDASTFIKGNFISLFLIYLSVSFSWHMRQLHLQET